jgi:mannose-6-phosphate isomerase-like protein (cupin superfamily)
MTRTVNKAEESAEYFFEEGCFILELSNSPDDPALSIARARVEAGTKTRWHRLSGVIERYVILSGSGSVEVGEELPAGVSAGDVVTIPAMTSQRIINTGESDLVFLAICTPRFQRDCYQPLEQEPD